MGLGRLVASASTFGLVSPTSHGHRTAKYSKRTARSTAHMEALLVEQNRILRGDPPPPTQDERIRARVERVANGLDRFNAHMEAKHGPLENTVGALATKPRREINLWCIWAIVTVILLFVSPWTLIGTGAWAIYLVSVRQRAKRLAAQREHDAVADAETEAIPVAGSRHSR